MFPYKPLLRLLFWLIFYCLNAVYSIAANLVVIDEDLQQCNVTPIIGFYSAQQKDLPPDSIIQILRSSDSAYGFDYFDVNYLGFYWVYVPIVNNTSQPQELIFEIDNPHIDTLFLWRYNKQQLVYTADITGDCLPFDTRGIEHRNFLHGFVIAPQDTVEILANLCKYGQPMALQFSLYSKDYFYSNDAIHSNIHMLIFGALVFAIMLILIYSFYLEKYASFFIAIAMSCLLSEAAWQLGYGFQYLCRNLVWYNNFMRISFLTACVFFNLLFVYKTLNIKQYSLSWARAFKLISSILVLLLINLFLLAYWGYRGYSWGLKTFFIITNLLIIVAFVVITTFLYCYRHTQKATIYLYMSYFYVSGCLYMLLYILILTQPYHLLPYLFIKHLSLSCCVIFVFLSTTYVIHSAYEQQKQNMLLREKANRSLLMGQEQERRRIALELHDNINSSVFALQNHLQLAPFTDPQIKETLISNTIKISKNIRSISHRLSPIMDTSQPLSELIGNLCCNMQDVLPNTIIEYLPNIPNHLFLNSHLHKTTLYRIVQELLFNIAKHAQATHAKVMLYIENQQLHLLVIDNGVGFNPDTVPKGMGLYNIQNYAQLINAKHRIISTSQNTSIEFYIPYH